MIWVGERSCAPGCGARLVDDLRNLGFKADLYGRDGTPQPDDAALIEIDKGTHAELLEYILTKIPVDFDALPILADGDSKQVRLWTDQVVLLKFKPTVYSFTMNRYGEAPGTDAVRLRFTSALFRRMAQQKSNVGIDCQSAFLAELANGGPLLAERRVDPGNLEIRVKRYHIGSPLHRYRLVERYETTQGSGPIRRWSRFNDPVVCFDWRNPLHDDHGNRFADEPLSDDYARLWMRDAEHAKTMVRDVFLWMEEWFAAASVRLVDMCVFVDREGRMIFGEISPDCMRVHLSLDDPTRAETADKDLWRAGKSPELLLARYEELYHRLFC